MSKKPSEPDFSEFQTAVKGVKPFKNTRIDLYAQRKNTHPFRDDQQYESAKASHHLSDQQHYNLVTGDEFIFFARPGLQLKTQKQLRQGKIPVDDHLDLHGLSINEARETLIEFINFATKQQIRCILLVHGKGYRSNTAKPVLKNKVNSWLRQHPDILGFSSAQDRDGGSGAVYIIIRKTFISP